jgi:hypothetical protein
MVRDHAAGARRPARQRRLRNPLKSAGWLMSHRTDHHVLRKCLPAAAFAVLACILCALSTASGAGNGEQAFDLRSGQEVTFAVTIAGGKVTVGPARASKLGAAQPKDGEMTIGLGTRDKTLHEQILVTEKTALPIDFIATGLIGDIKIDESVLCGRLDAPTSAHIGAVSWRVRMHAFEVGKGGETCE